MDHRPASLIKGADFFDADTGLVPIMTQWYAPDRGPFSPMWDVLKLPLFCFSACVWDIFSFLLCIDAPVSTISRRVRRRQHPPTLLFLPITWMVLSGIMGRF